jgi:hypothetical protein
MNDNVPRSKHLVKLLLGEVSAAPLQAEVCHVNAPIDEVLDRRAPLYETLNAAAVLLQHLWLQGLVLRVKGALQAGEALLEE